MAGEQPIFFYDLASPACYLAAEVLVADLPVVPEWEPVLAHDLGDPDFAAERELVELVEREAPGRVLQPLRWPPRLDGDARETMLAATYAKHIGRVVAFSLACFRQTFAAGRDPGDQNTMLLAAAACEMHPTAVLKGISLRSVGQALQGAGERARAEGVQSLPALRLGQRTYQGAMSIDLAVREFESVR